MFRGHTVRYVVAATSALGLVVGACGGSSTDSVGSTESAAAATEPSVGSEPPVASAAQAVIDALNAEANGMFVSELEFGMWEGANALPIGVNRWYFCDRRVELRVAVVEQMPDQLGDASIDAVYLPYLEARRADVDALATACDDLAASRGVTNPTEAPQVPPSLVAMNDEILGLCFELVEPLSSYGVLNCDAIPTDEPFIDLPSATLLNELGVDPNWRRDADLTATPIDDPCPNLGSMLSDRVEVGPGLLDCTWFARPFTMDHPEVLLLQATTDALQLVPAEDGHSLALWALDELADPSDLVAFPPGPAIPFPADLTDWWSAMPVEVLEVEEFELNGLLTTRWLIRGVEAEVRAATGEEVVHLGSIGSDNQTGLQLQGGILVPPPDLPDEFLDAPAFNEEQVYMYWHIRTPTGPLLAEMFTFTEFGPELDWASDVLESITFVDG